MQRLLVSAAECLATRWMVTGLTLLAVAGCAHGQNYLDPAGPRFTGGVAMASTPVRMLRVVTFNIQYSREIDRAIELFTQDPALRDVDLIFLQEMDEVGVDRLARALGLQYIYYPATRHPVPHQDFGNAVLSRWPIEEDRKVILPHLGWWRRTQRIAVAATVRVGEQRVEVYAVHLATLLEIGYGGLRDQARAVLADAARGGAERIIIAGDMNSPAIGEQFEATGFAWPTRDLGRTHGMFDVDHVFARGFEIGPAPAAGIIKDNHGASDHQPVWAVLGM